MLCSGSEVLFGTGLPSYDLLLSAHDFIKLGLAPLSTVIETSPSSFLSPAFRARQFGPGVYFEFVFQDSDGKEHLRGRDLNVWASDEAYYNALISCQPPTQLSPLPADSTTKPMQHRLKPIKFSEGSVVGVPILGLCGIQKLRIGYDSSRNELVMPDEKHDIDFVSIFHELE